jgi:hypothetical protein
LQTPSLPLSTLVSCFYLGFLLSRSLFRLPFLFVAKKQAPCASAIDRAIFSWICPIAKSPA